MHCHTAGSVAPCHRAGRASGLRTSSVFAGTTRCCASRAVGNTLTTTECAPPTAAVGPSRWDALALLAASPLLLLNAAPAAAIQGTIAGRIPGVSKDMDEDGYFTYTRPEGKSGGHGVGWSEIPRYSFKIPPGWEEVPVSIADLGGTEIDLRFSSKEAGDLFVVVAPVLRFRDVGYNADVRIEELGDPDTIIAGFAPELFGGPIDEETIQKTDVVRSGPLTYYQWQLKPHNLVVATAYRNRVFICTVQANGRQWKKHSDSLLHIQKSFSVPTWA